MARFFGAEGERQSALSRWLVQQQQATQQFAGAEKPLRQAVQLFQPGGGYGRGQATLLQEQARQAQAEALSTQVATGMSSGSLATGTGLRVKKDLAQGLAGVEDVRTQFLTQALQSLGGLRGTQAQTTAAVSDPTYAPYMSYLGGAENRALQERMALIQERSARKRTYMQTEAQKYIADLRANTTQPQSRTQPRTQGSVYSTMRF